MVMSDLLTGIDPSPPALSRLIESATYCRPEDEKRPGLVGLPDSSTTQVCPDDLAKSSDTQGTAEGAPPSWFLRVVFDELLDPNVEDLIPELDAMMKPTGTMLGSFANTQPVTLKCRDSAGNSADVLYNGYYVPNGNRVSWPLGPALFVQPVNPLSVQTGAACEIGIKDMVHNKNGQQVPTDQRSFPFKIAPMTLRFSNPDPSDDDPGKIELDPDSPVAFFWTAAFTTMPLATEIHIFEGPNSAKDTGDPTVCGSGGTAVASAEIATAPRGAGAATSALVMNLSLNLPVPDDVHAWKPQTTYRVQFGANAKITPKQGGADGTFPTTYNLCFHTTDPAP